MRAPCATGGGSPQLASRQLVRRRDDAQPQIIVAGDVDAAQRIERTPWASVAQPCIVVLDSNGAQSLTWAGLAETGALERDRMAAELVSRMDAVRTGDPATYIYTSGTTGPPKGVELTHGNLLSDCGALVQAGLFDFDYRNVCYLPLAHIVERLWSIYLPLLTGGHVLCCDDPNNLRAHLRTHRPTFFMAVPRVWEKLRRVAIDVMDSPAFDSRRGALEQDLKSMRRMWELEQEDAPVPAVLRTAAVLAREGATREVREQLGLDRVVHASTAAAPPSQALLGFFASLGIEILQGYGLTETGGPATSERLGSGSRGTVGLPLPGFAVRITADGEIEVRGPGVTSRYRNRPDATAELFTADGWLRTGDLGEIDTAGRLRINGRRKELIINAAGQNISPTAVESLIANRSFVDHALAFADDRTYLVALLTVSPERAAEFLGRHGAASDDVLTHPLVMAEAQAVVDEANRHLSRPEQVKRFRLLPATWSVQTGELTPTFKLRRAVIHERYRDHIEALYAQ